MMYYITCNSSWGGVIFHTCMTLSIDTAHFRLIIIVEILKLFWNHSQSHWLLFGGLSFVYQCCRPPIWNSTCAVSFSFLCDITLAEVEPSSTHCNSSKTCEMNGKCLSQSHIDTFPMKYVPMFILQKICRVS